QPRDQTRGARRAAEAALLERTGDRVDEHGAVGGTLGQLADDLHHLVVRGGVRACLGIHAGSLGRTRRRRGGAGPAAPPAPAPPGRGPRRRRPRPSRGAWGGCSAGSSAGAMPVSRRYERRRNSTPRSAATSPTASKARSSEMISTTSPGRALPSHTPALTA